MSIKPLQPLQHYSGPKGPVLLCILDGVGIGKNDDSDGVYRAKTPCLDQLKTSPYYCTLNAHGISVGMPTDSDMGNSEVGHNTLGAGRVFPQGASLVNNAIQSGDLMNGDTWKRILRQCKEHGSCLHLIGLLSDGNVHSHINHVIALAQHAAAHGITTLRLHALLDGRDVEQRSALGYIDTIETVFQELSVSHNVDFRIASGGGRMVITMDRYSADWSMVDRGWKTHVLGEAPHFKSARDAVLHGYEDPAIHDQYLPPFVIADSNGPIGTIHDNDSVVLFNYRGDRAIELTQAFEQDNFTHFDRKRRPTVLFAGMMEYDGDLRTPSNFLVPPPKLQNPLSAYLCQLNIPSFAISETQKFGHVTYFWNGNRSGYINKNIETYIEIPSKPIPFEDQPEMQSHAITEKTISLLQSGSYKFGRVNFPNGDMIGHTGVEDAIIESVRITDLCLTRLIECVNQLNGITIVCADHGNADELYTLKNDKKIIKTAHSINPVPFAIIDNNHTPPYTLNPPSNPGLANIAATLCNLLGYHAPPQYEGSLITF